MKDEVLETYRVNAQAVSDKFVRESAARFKATPFIAGDNYELLYDLLKEELKKMLETETCKKALHFHIIKNHELQPLIEAFIDKVKNTFFDEIVLFVDYKFVRKWV